MAGQARVWLTLQQKGHSDQVNKEALFSRPWRAPEDVLAERTVTLTCMRDLEKGLQISYGSNSGNRKAVKALRATLGLTRCGL